MVIAPQFSYFTRITEGKRNPTRRQQTKDGKEKLPPGVDHVEDRASTPQSKEDRDPQAPKTQNQLDIIARKRRRTVAHATKIENILVDAAH